jgi:hypothetical protein
VNAPFLFLVFLSNVEIILSNWPRKIIIFISYSKQITLRKAAYSSKIYLTTVY